MRTDRSPPTPHATKDWSNEVPFGNWLMEQCLGNKCVRCVIGTFRWVPVLFVWAIICWAYYTYVVAFCFGMVGPIGVKLILLITVISPIGRPPELFNLPHQIRTELGAATNEIEFKAILERFARDRKIPIASRSNDGAVRCCLKCSCVKPDRCHHCSVCGHCVLKFDHHCPWVNTCINFNNYKFFMLFLGYGSVLCFFGFFTILPYFISFWQRGDLSQTEVSRFLVFFLFFVAGLFGLSMGCLFFYHLFLISKNRSTIESFRPPIFTHGADKCVYNLGVRRNFEEVFGSDKRKWLLPLFSSNGNGTAFRNSAEVFRSRYSPVSTIGHLTGSSSSEEDDYDHEMRTLLT
uniref:Palmitoyltransferase n=1 Tax=Globodera rostochiensis TaxID=31243 RepID=A0A914GXP5_GLORO